MEENEKITPSQYFDYIKNAKNEITAEVIKESFGTFLKLADKYKRLEQKESLKKLCFLADVLRQEEKLIDMGITTYIYKDVIEDYIEHVADSTVKIVELARYMREIPDELVEVVEGTKGIFDQFYVVFTDYTGKEERKVEKERRDKDPILFGVFKKGGNVSDRFYFLGDWVDEYCDLTLDKMVEQYKEKKGYSPANEIEVPKDSEDLIRILKTYEIDSKEDETRTLKFEDMSVDVPNYKTSKKDSEKQTKGFLQMVKSVFKKK